MYTVAFGPHATNFADVMEAISPQFKALDNGYDLTIDGEDVRLFSYPIGFLGDMPQQNEGAGIQGPTGHMSCRWCMVHSDQRGDMTYDVIANKRHVLEQEEIRIKADEMDRKGKKKDLYQSYGLSREPSPITAIWKSCDPTSDFLNDPCHSELAGMMKLSANILFNDVLTAKGKAELGKLIATFPMPQGWNRLQSPTHHLESYQIQEYGRLSIILPVVLRIYLKREWIQPRVREAMVFFFKREIDNESPEGERILVSIFARISRSNRLLISWSDEATNADEVMKVVKQARSDLQLLEHSIIMSIGTSNSKAETRQSSVALTGACTPSRRGEVRAKVIEKMKKRPNMHIALHYGQMIEDYGCANNGNVLLGEDRHRKFKSMVTHTNHRNPEQTMLIRDSMNKTWTCLLNGSVKGDQGLCSVLQELKDECPTLMDRYQRRNADGGPEYKLSSRDLAKVATRLGLKTTNLKHVDSRDQFIVELTIAHQDRSGADVRRQNIVFWKKLTFSPK